MDKIIFLDEEFLDEIQEYSEIDKTNIEKDLSKNTDIMVKIVNRCGKVKRELKKVKREYDEMWASKYAFYGHESDVVPDNDTERKAMVKADTQMQSMQELIDEYETDLENLVDLKDVFRQKSYDLGTILKNRMFEHGA